MPAIRICASAQYDVIIENGILDRAGAELADRFGLCRVMVVTDDAVDRLYGARLMSALTAAGIAADKLVIPQGEASKCADQWLALLNALAERGYSRTDMLCALGGGVVGDLTGFAAATFLRGIGYIGIPTTLLACVDSSVGGKTAIDLAAGKNLAGAFHQPSLVLCDPQLLDSLPPEVCADGFAEVIKYGVIGDPQLFGALGGRTAPAMEEVIARCVKAKASFVETDERDHGMRKHLNFGHTAGHAIEACAKFGMLHGHGVACGMMIAARYAAGRGICAPDIPMQIAALLKRYGLPTESPYPAEALYEAACRDKKRDGGQIDLVLPVRIGSSVLRRIPIDGLRDFLREGMEG